LLRLAQFPFFVRNPQLIHTKHKHKHNS
jgi:hypothetical protein